MANSRNATLAEEVAVSLRQALHDGAYLSGDRLTELDIANEMTVSQNTVREALRILEIDGWVIKFPRQGVYVRQFTRDEIQDIFDLRLALESLALQWLLVGMTSEQMAAIRQYMAQARSQAEANNSAGIRAALFAFHKLLAQIPSRPITADILQQLHNHTRLMQNKREAQEPRPMMGWLRQMEEYDRMIAHIEAGDLRQAQAALAALLQRDCNELLANP